MSEADQVQSGTEELQHPGVERAWALFELDRPHEALAEAAQALRDDPDDGGALRVSALSLAQLAQPEPARRMAEQLVGAHPDWAYAHATLAWVAHEPDVKLAAWHEAVDLEPDDTFLLGSLAYSLLSGGRLADAQRYLDCALQLDPEDPDLLALLSRVDLAGGNLVAARRHLDQALARDAQNLEARLAAVMLRFKQGGREAAVLELGALLAEHPRNIALRQHLHGLLEHLLSGPPPNVQRLPLLNLLLVAPVQLWWGYQARRATKRWPSALRQSAAAAGLRPPAYPWSSIGISGAAIVCAAALVAWGLGGLPYWTIWPLVSLLPMALSLSGRMLGGFDDRPWFEGFWTFALWCALPLILPLTLVRSVYRAVADPDDTELNPWSVGMGLLGVYLLLGRWAPSPSARLWLVGGGLVALVSGRWLRRAHLRRRLWAARA